MEHAVRRRIAGLTAALIVVVPLSVVAGRWQWQRHLERDAMNTAVLASEATAPVPWQALLGGGYRETADWRRVTATGTWVPAGQLLVRKQVVNGSVGYTVSTPFRAADGTLLYVMRGWIPDATSTIPAPPADTQTITVRVRPVEGEGPIGAPDLPAGQVNRIDPAVLAKGAPHVEALFELLDPVPTGLVALPWPELSEGPHLGYVIQWALIGATAIFVYIRVMSAEVRPKEQEDPEPRADTDPTASA